MEHRLGFRKLLLWEVVFAVAFAARVLYFATARGTAFEHPLIDADYYDFLGQELSLGRGFPEGPFWQPPLYPLFLGALYKVAGHTLWAPRFVQALLGAATAALAFEIALRVTSRRPLAFAAGLMVALHGPLIFYDGELLPTSLATFGGAVALWLALPPGEATARPRAAIGRAAGTGAVIGLASLAVAPMLLLIAPLALLAASATSGGRRARALAGAAACAACALVVLPATIANHSRSGEWIAISANGGVNLWIGNNPDVDKAMTLRPGAGWEELVQEPERHGAIRPGAQDAYFIDKALGWCGSHPLACLKNVAHKTHLLLVARELPRNEDLYTVKSQSPVLDVLALRAGSFALPYALLLPLAAVGVVASLRARRREDWVLLGVAGALALTPIVFFVSGRYRAPLAPSLCVLAAVGLGQLWDRRRAPPQPAKGRWTPELAGAIVLAVALWPVHLPLDQVDFTADMHYAAGGRLARLGKDALAVEQWSRVVARRPDFIEAAYNMALAQLRLKRPRDAVRTCDEVLRHRPGHFELRLLRADALLDAGELPRARQAFQELLAERPGDLQALAGLIHVAIAMRDADAADALLDRAERALGPQNPELLAMRKHVQALRRGAAPQPASPPE